MIGPPLASDIEMADRVADLEGRVRSLEAGITPKDEQHPRKKMRRHHFWCLEHSRQVSWPPPQGRIERAG